MPCNWMRLPGGGVAHLNTTRRIKRCIYCKAMHEFLCDFPVGEKNKKGKYKTCSAPLCSVHTQKGNNPEFDFCRPHFPVAAAAYERRKAGNANDQFTLQGQIEIPEEKLS